MDASTPPGDFQKEIGVSKESELKSGAIRTAQDAPSTPLPLQDGIEVQDLNHILPIDGSSEKNRSNFRIWAIMIALCLSLFIAALDQTIVATAIPTISADLHSATGYTWIGGAYLLANAAASPIWAKLSDIWGRKLILLVAVAWFAASSIVCAKASSMRMLIAGRALQGTAGGGLTQLCNITISDVFSVRTRSLFLAFLEFVWAVAGGIGPILGGVFSELANWRWCFWINLPISGITFILLFFFLDVHNPRTKVWDGLKAIDWFGSLTIIGLVLMLLLGLDFGGVVFPWSSPTVICLIVFGALMSVFFVFSEKRLAKYPLMPLALFRHKSNTAALVVTFLHGMVFIACEYYLPLYFQSVHESSPLHSGLLIIPISISEAVVGIICGVLIHRTGRYQEIIWFGLIFLTVGNGLYITFGVGTPIAHIIGFELIQGIGAGCIFEAPLIALHAKVAQDDTATATATCGFIRNMATACSIVIGGAIFQNGMASRRSDFRAAGLPANLTEAFAGGDAAANVWLIADIQDQEQELAVKGAYADSLRTLWILTTCLSGVALVVSVFIKGWHLGTEHTETRTGLKEKVKEALPLPALGTTNAGAREAGNSSV
ncbi:putative MFS transporter [Aulographum hederae CBS 113979]|uniref:Putative MFS transporter n=1 Tax=Aulographum hederae CBS 113979 TaxID=1176131 RepID=A0A6G1H2J2_9PEZI|nr:putative MFS transporter [Aulographum hederae CBS 113979]